MSHWRFPRYVTVGEKRARAEKKREQLRKKHPDIRPVIVAGRTIANTWWGKSWNNNLERYADYANRIGRGRSYVRHGAVLDLGIDPGSVTAMVQGSRAKPYAVQIRIKGLNPQTWAAIIKGCAGKFDSLQDLLAGKFPQSLSDIFTAPGKGLFPSPSEIALSCSCPDWAVMCKHVAATLYGIGVRLDEDPSLFFTLRKVEITDLVAEAVEETTDKLLEKAKGKRKGVIADADIASVFGIVMEDTTSFDNAELPKPERPVRRPVSGPRSVSAASGRKKRTTADRKRVLDLVTRSEPGIDVPSLRKKTGLDTARIRNIVYTAFKRGDIDRSGRGLYKGKGDPVDPAKETDVVVALIRQSPKGISISSIKSATGMPDARVRYVISRACGKGAIERVSRGVYTAVDKDVAPEKPTDAVLKIIGKSKMGISVSGIVKESGFAEKKIRNILYRLNKLGKIKRKQRGVYVAAGMRLPI
jgi:uncharacterized Zn finger protein/predicted transcriptional regulator of viral defense system